MATPMKIFSRMSIAAKLAVVTALTGIGILVLAISFTLSEKGLIAEQNKLAVRDAVDTATGVVERYQKLEAEGKMSSEQARLEALETLRGMRYNGSEYFWVNDLEPRMLMHPNSAKLQGQPLVDITDPTGKHQFLEMVQVVRNSGAGYVAYMWPKPGSDKPVAKISYVKGVPAWGWIVGSGVYTDSIDAVFWPRVLEFSTLAILLSGTLMLVVYLIARSIRLSLSKAVKLADTVASGDLTAIIEVDGTGELANLLLALREMNRSLSMIVGEVDNGINTIANASSEIATGNLDLSNRTEQQASALEETAATMEELTTAVQQNAENARQASVRARSAIDVAVQGGAIVDQVVHTMASIQTSAQRITDIIGVIDGIAFQTNILALNAAVEAARAGEQGRGFAVVASEVRTLAQRSAAAAKEIKCLIEDSVSKIDDGSNLVKRAGTTMKDIVASVQYVGEIIDDISVATLQQQEGISQVNSAISEMDSTTQQNAALVEQAAAAASSMNSQTQHLSQVFGTFKVNKATAGSRRLMLM